VAETRATQQHLKKFEKKSSHLFFFSKVPLIVVQMLYNLVILGTTISVPVIAQGLVACSAADLGPNPPLLPLSQSKACRKIGNFFQGVLIHGAQCFERPFTDG
jgi:hypothetical protein